MRILRFKLRTLFACTAIAAVTLAVLIRWDVASKSQAAAVKRIEALQGVVLYHHQVSHDGHILRNAQLPRPGWIRREFGIDYVDHPVMIDFWETGPFVDTGSQDFECFSQLKSVHTIKCFDGPVFPSAMPFLKKLPHLRRLKLQRCNFDSDDAIASLRELKHLEELIVISELPNSGFTDDGIRCLRFSKWSKLRRLVIGSPSMTKASLEEIARVPGLDYLGLACNTLIDDTAVSVLGRMTKLKELDISGTKISNAGLRQLRSMLGDCKVSAPEQFY